MALAGGLVSRVCYRVTVWRNPLLLFMVCANAARLRFLAIVAHGLWVWSTPSILAAPHGAETLRDFCQREAITEVYVSTSGHPDLAPLIGLLHHAGIRVEALFSSTNADEPGPHRDKLLGEVHEIIRFNQQHPNARFDGIHLDIEPQQRPENKGAGNLAYLPNLIDTYRAVRAAGDAAGLTVDADIQSKVLKAPADERLALFTSLTRLTLMLYEQRDPDAASRMLALAYNGLNAPNLATMAIALRTPDYGDRLADALHALDDAERGNPHYAGWARHSYNDVATAATEK
jgi:hypothetical protein